MDVVQELPVVQGRLLMLHVGGRAEIFLWDATYKITSQERNFINKS